jgi:hypothetical protein
MCSVLDGKGTVSKEPVGCVWYRPRIVTRHLDECAGTSMLPVVAVAVVGVVAITGRGGRLEMVACSTQQQLVKEDYYKKRALSVGYSTLLSAAFEKNK